MYDHHVWIVVRFRDVNEHGARQVFEKTFVYPLNDKQQPQRPR
jgi:hypothetical protein